VTTQCSANVPAAFVNASELWLKDCLDVVSRT
jgi:hypothetical protein